MRWRNGEVVPSPTTRGGAPWVNETRWLPAQGTAGGMRLGQRNRHAVLGLLVFGALFFAAAALGIVIGAALRWVGP